MSENLNELYRMNVDKDREKGYTKEQWFRMILSGGNIDKFKKLTGESMSEFKDVVVEQNQAIDLLLDQWAKSFRKLQTDTEENKKFIRKNTGDIKDSCERLKQGMDKFISSVDYEKLEKIAASISIITECLVAIDKLSTEGKLEKLTMLLKP